MRGKKLSVPDASELSRQSFVVDLMLMRLGRWLRLMGQDAANPEGGSDWQIRDQAKRDHRTVITRDRRLYESCLKASQPCLFIRSSRIEEQLLEVAGAGCLCDWTLRDAPYATVIWKRSPRSGKEQWQCCICSKVYWQGSHWRKMERMLEEIGSRRGEN